MIARDIVLALFEMTADQFELAGVRRMGKSWQTNDSNEKIYKFIGIITANSDVKTVKPDEDELVMLLNDLRTQQQELGGPDLVFPVTYKFISKQTGKEVKKKFNFSTHLSPRTLLGVEVVDGMYYVKVEMFGIFY